MIFGQRLNLQYVTYDGSKNELINSYFRAVHRMVLIHDDQIHFENILSDEIQHIAETKHFLL